MKAAAYCRVSSNREEQLKSLEKQKEQFAQYLKENQGSSTDIGMLCRADGTTEPRTDGLYIDEGITGTSTKRRAAFNQMVQDAISGKFNTILVEDVSRFSRNMEDALTAIKDLREHGIGISFRKEGINTLDAARDFELQLRISIAEEESRKMSQRVKWALNKNMAEGQWNSQPPYGYDKVHGFLKVNEEESKIVKLMFSLYLDGKGIGAITNYLNSNNIKPRNANIWRQLVVKRIITNELYTGNMFNHKVTTNDITRHTKIAVPDEERYSHNIEPIIDEEIWKQAQELLEQHRKMHAEGTRHSSKYSLSTLLYCDNCGGAFKRKVAHNKERSIEWTCAKRDMYKTQGCDTPVRACVKESNMMECIKQEIKARQHDNLDYLLEAYKAKILAAPITSIETLEQQMAAAQSEMRQLRKDKAAGLIDEVTYKDDMKDIQSRLEGIRCDINAIHNQQHMLEMAELKYKQFQHMLKEVDLDNLSNSQLKQIFKRVILRMKFVDGRKKMFARFEYAFLDVNEEELIEDDTHLWRMVQ